MYDLTRSDFSLIREKTIAAGQSFTESGVCVVRVIEGGEERVQASAGSAGENFIGFTVRDNQSYSRMPVVEEATVPSSAPLEVQLDHTNLVSSTLRVYDATNDVDLTVVLVAPAAGEVQVALSTGLLTFNAAEAGIDIVAYYTYSLTVEESVRLFHERAVNNKASATFGQIGVGGGSGIIYTSEYITANDFSATAGVPATVYSGAGGKLTTTATGANVGRVVHVPTVDLPLLGVAFTSQLG